MSYEIKYGKTVFLKYGRDIASIDEAVFTKDMQGTFKNELLRYLKYPNEFIVLLKDGKVIAYMQYFPLVAEYANKVMEDDEIHDDNIVGKDIKRLSKNEPNDIYLLSVAMYQDYHGTDAMQVLARAMSEKLLAIHDAGYPIGRIISTAISDKGRSTLSKFGLDNIKTLQGGYSLFVGDIDTWRESYKSRLR